MTVTQDRRQQRREIRLIQSHSSWLQKALFALHQAEAAHEKLQEANGDEAEPLVLEHEDGAISLEAFEEALESRIKDLLTETRERRRAIR